jgi:hypothetical protein
MSDESVIIVKKGNVVTTFPKTELLKVAPTHDGIIFEFIGGLHLYYAQPFMDNGTKEKICQNLSKFHGKIIVDLLNPTVPVTIQIM